MQHTSTMSRAEWTFLLLCWLVALASTLGSMFFSEVMALEPCVLCWYQRIAMFPLVPILSIALYKEDSRGVTYAIPLAAAGWLTAAYHSLLYAGYIPKGMQPCGKGPSCADANLDLAGFLSIPALSFLAFTIILSLLIAVNRGTDK